MQTESDSDNPEHWDDENHLPISVPILNSTKLPTRTEIQKLCLMQLGKQDHQTGLNFPRTGPFSSGKCLPNHKFEDGQNECFRYLPGYYLCVKDGRSGLAVVPGLDFPDGQDLAHYGVSRSRRSFDENLVILTARNRIPQSVLRCWSKVGTSATLKQEKGKGRATSMTITNSPARCGSPSRKRISSLPTNPPWKRAHISSTSGSQFTSKLFQLSSELEDSVDDVDSNSPFHLSSPHQTLYNHPQTRSVTRSLHQIATVHPPASSSTTPVITSPSTTNITIDLTAESEHESHVDLDIEMSTPSPAPSPSLLQVRSSPTSPALNSDVGDMMEINPSDSFALDPTVENPWVGSQVFEF
ncbi:hypothetical protein PAXINDRAFT_14590 [Paxillus involutus ATCC 200175]|uniref:Uncharacterized protein n=1 Tax=Paxillus involutus ATCC 200175 TaxID=664439 RepID=A0A0C9TA44_PAXIN|nr:hypothetical protein PAXINDRAFT_14590 [Paxillus involutus ATCC 200175]